MRVELRSSGGPVCHECGSYELLRLPQNGQPLAQEIGDILARLDADISADLNTRFDLLVADWRGQLRRFMDDEAADVRTAMLEALEPVPAWYQPWKRRWREKTLAEIEAAAAGLKAKTYLI